MLHWLFGMGSISYMVRDGNNNGGDKGCSGNDDSDKNGKPNKPYTQLSSWWKAHYTFRQAM